MDSVVNHDAEPGLLQAMSPANIQYVMSNCSCTQGYTWRTCFCTLFQHKGHRLSWRYTQTHPEPSRKPPNCFQLYWPQGSSNITSNENIMWWDKAAQENWTAISSMALQGTTQYHIHMHLIFVAANSLCDRCGVCDYELNLCSSFWSFLCFVFFCVVFVQELKPLLCQLLGNQLTSNINHFLTCEQHEHMCCQCNLVLVAAAP